MPTDSVSQRYAESLFEAAKADGRIDEAARGMAALRQLIAAHGDLREFLGNPGVEIPDKLGVLQRLLAGAWSSDLESFLRMTLAMGRAAHLADIARDVQDLVDRSRGLVRVRVRSARPLAAPLKARLAQTLERREGRKVEVVEETAPELLGGVQIFLDSRMLDGSIRTQLDRLRQQLKRVRV